MNSKSPYPISSISFAITTDEGKIERFRFFPSYINDLCNPIILYLLLFFSIFVAVMSIISVTAESTRRLYALIFLVCGIFAGYVMRQLILHNHCIKLRKLVLLAKKNRTCDEAQKALRRIWAGMTEEVRAIYPELWYLDNDRFFAETACKPSEIKSYRLTNHGIKHLVYAFVLPIIALFLPLVIISSVFKASLFMEYRFLFSGALLLLSAIIVSYLMYKRMLNFEITITPKQIETPWHFTIWDNVEKIFIWKTSQGKTLSINILDFANYHPIYNILEHLDDLDGFAEEIANKIEPSKIVYKVVSHDIICRLYWTYGIPLLLHCMIWFIFYLHPL